MENKWYIVGTCCMGYVDGKYMPFPTENEYFEYLADKEEN